MATPSAQPANVEWRPIIGHPHYVVSSTGKVRRAEGRIILRPFRRGSKHRKPYFAVSLYLHGVRHDRAVHQLVAEAFIGHCPDGHELNHIDRDKTNNASSNLEYITHHSNVFRGSSHYRARITANDVMDIRAATGTPRQLLAARYGLTVRAIGSIISKRNWKRLE